MRPSLVGAPFGARRGLGGLVTGAGGNGGGNGRRLFVLACDVEVQLVALGAALDLVVDRLHGLEVLAGELVWFEDSRDRHLAAQEAPDGGRQRAKQLLAGGRREFPEPRVAA